MVDKRLKPAEKTNGNQAAFEISVQPPQVKVGAPQIQLDVEAPQLNMDTSDITAALQGLSTAMQQLAEQQNQLLRTIVDHHAVINKALGNQPTIEVQAPVIKSAPRPRSFTVEVEDDAGDVTATMNIKANSSH